MSKHSFDTIRERYLPAVENHLATFLNASKSQGQRLSAEMTAYHLETGGKRLRALIPLYVYDVLGRSAADAIPLGAAIEMVHNATLVHDDLQDGDEVRRSRPTVWKKYSAAQAINCGDAMFYYAIRLVNELKIDARCLVRLCDRLALSTLNVIEGQAQEFAMKDETYPGVDRYLGVIRGKTSGLFALPIVGALEALGIDDDRCRFVEAAAMDLGMLFQIQDDVLDVYGNKGRDRVATDVAEGKISIFVAHVNEAGTPAEKAGVEPGDVILKFDGKVIDRESDLPRLVGATRPGSRVQLQVWRKGKAVDLPITVAEMEPDAPARRPDQAQRPTPAANALGLTVSDVPADKLKELKLRSAVQVDAVDGAAARAGLRQGDLIVALNNVEVANARQFNDAVAKLDPKRNVVLLVRRGEQSNFIVIRPLDRQ